SDFFIPGDYTPYNFSAMSGMETGNFNHYTKSSFSIPGKGIPLNFEHSYNSCLTEYPDEFVPLQPLGKGWSHNYNAYLINTDEILDNYGNVIGKPCLIVFWPNGSMNVYDNTGTPASPPVITKGVYDQLTRVSSGVYTVKTKTQVTYTFTKPAGAKAGTPYMMTSVSDRNGNATVLTYEFGVDSVIRLKSVKDPVNRTLTFTYPVGSNYISRITDPLNRHIDFTVSDGLLATFSDAKSQITQYRYDTASYGSGLLDTIILPRGNRITNQYQQRKLVSSRFNNNSPTQITHTINYASGVNDFLKSTVVQPLATGQSVTTSYEFDRNRSATKIYGNPAVNMTNQFANTANPLLPTAIANNNSGVSIVNTYDSQGNVTHVVTSGPGMAPVHEYFEYNGTNDLVKHTDANGNVTQYTYDANGNLLKVTDALGKETAMGYNGSGQVTQVTNPAGVSTGFSYSPQTGMPSSIQVPALGLTSTMNYDLASRLLSATDFKGNVTSYTYDNNDNMTQEKDALNHTTGYAYDVNDNLLAITNAMGGVTSMTYDTATDWLLSESFQGNTRSYTYHYDGSLKTLTDPNGNLFNYTYDLAGRVTSDGYATYAYNGAGNLTGVTKAGKAVQFSYDGFNRVSSTSYDGFSVGYTYDNANNITKIIYPGNKQVTYTYDALNRMKTVTDWNGKTTTYNYRDDGELLSMVYPNGITTTYSYDAAGRQTGLSTKRANGTVIAEYTYLLDNLGNHLQEDIVQPLVSYPKLKDPVTNYTYNNANRILTAGSDSFTFDFNGNTTGKTGYSFAYDTRNNLTSVTGRLTANYSYDGLGFRREASYTGIVKKFILDIQGLSKALLETDANGNPQNYYIWGLGLISRIKPDNTTGYYVSDFRGSIVAMTDATVNATVTHKYNYDEFGTVTKAVEADFNPFRYVGKYGVMWEDSSLVFMRARYYDNTIGRFLSEDPVWSTNLYAYVGNNSISFVDPKGLYKYDNQVLTSIKLQLMVTEQKNLISDVNRILELSNQIDVSEKALNSALKKANWSEFDTQKYMGMVEQLNSNVDDINKRVKEYNSKIKYSELRIYNLEAQKAHVKRTIKNFWILVGGDLISLIETIIGAQTVVLPFSEYYGNQGSVIY
ncbi:MAG TPA: RHS repeat-associated core domain-containing protein, partial [Bacteroidales bacterium]|nr:RHS repeat-associated core domain-containing protein [Bacteroidales bacterium]